MKAQAVSGETPKRELAQILARYEAGDIDVLVNAQLLAEGWNSPRATVCMHLAPTASKRIYQQRVGRVTRRHQGKEAGIVVDFVHPATKHDDPVVTLHSLLDRDVYRGGAIVVGPVRRGRGRRLRVERRVLPVTSEENRRIEVFERELWRIAVEHLDYGEQVQWAALAGARVAPTGWRRARAMLHFDQGGELKRTFLITAVDRNKNPALRLRALQEIASGRDAEAFDRALDFVESWPRDDKREGVKVVLQALAEKKIGRRDQANNWIWRCANMTREVHEEYAVQRWPETKRLLGLLVNSSGGAHARNARRLVAQARQQDRRLSAALLAAAIPHTAEAGEVINGARTRMARKPAALARELLRNFPKGRGKAKRRRSRRKGAGEGVAPEAALVGAVNDALDAVLDDDELELEPSSAEVTPEDEATPDALAPQPAPPRRGLRPGGRAAPWPLAPPPASRPTPRGRGRRVRGRGAVASLAPHAGGTDQGEGTPSRRSRRKPAAEPVDGSRGHAVAPFAPQARRAADRGRGPPSRDHAVAPFAPQAGRRARRRHADAGRGAARGRRRRPEAPSPSQARRRAARCGGRRSHRRPKPRRSLALAASRRLRSSRSAAAKPRARRKPAAEQPVEVVEVEAAPKPRARRKPAAERPRRGRRGRRGRRRSRAPRRKPAAEQPVEVVEAAPKPRARRKPAARGRRGRGREAACRASPPRAAASKSSTAEAAPKPPRASQAARPQAARPRARRKPAAQAPCRDHGGGASRPRPRDGADRQAQAGGQACGDDRRGRRGRGRGEEARRQAQAGGRRSRGEAQARRAAAARPRIAAEAGGQEEAGREAQARGQRPGGQGGRRGRGRRQAEGRRQAARQEARGGRDARGRQRARPRGRRGRRRLTMDVAGKVVVVTGGASGIGRALARAVRRRRRAGRRRRRPRPGGRDRRRDRPRQRDRDRLRRRRSRARRRPDRRGRAGLRAGRPVLRQRGRRGRRATSRRPADWDLAFDVNVRAHIAAAERLVPGLARARQRLLPHHRVRGRDRVADRLRALRRDQARRGRVRRVAEHHLRRRAASASAACARWASTPRC